MRNSDKSDRQQTISEILRNNFIDNQEDILRMLAEKGFEVTQATLSRDFREMKIAKTPDTSGQYVYRLPGMHLPESKPEKTGITSLFYRQGIINIDFSGQFAVIKTPEGYARGIATDIDANNIPGVMATISGVNTVLIILTEGADKAKIIYSLKILFSRNT